MMSTSMTAAAAAAVTPRLQARVADARSPARLTSSRRRPPTTRAGATSGDEDGGRIEKEGQSKIRNIQMEKASALREELEGIRGTLRRREDGVMRAIAYCETCGDPAGVRPHGVQLRCAPTLYFQTTTCGDAHACFFLFFVCVRPLLRGRARRLLSRGSRLVERGAELKAAAERAMIREVDRDEDEARRLLTERKKIRDTLDLTMARAEVLQELANKIGAAIIVLEHDTNYDDDDNDDDNDRSSPSSAAPFTASPSNAQPVKTMSEESLEREFAKLEINQLERMLQLSETPGEDQQVGGGGGPGISEAAKPTPAPGAAKIRPSDAEPAWWRPPTPCSAPESEEDGEAAARAAAGGVMTPLEALLEVDRARVSTAGVQGHHVVSAGLGEGNTPKGGGGIATRHQPLATFTPERRARAPRLLLSQTK